MIFQHSLYHPVSGKSVPYFPMHGNVDHNLKWHQQFETARLHHYSVQADINKCRNYFAPAHVWLHPGHLFSDILPPIGYGLWWPFQGLSDPDLASDTRLKPKTHILLKSKQTLMLDFSTGDLLLSL